MGGTLVAELAPSYIEYLMYVERVEQLGDDADDDARDYGDPEAAAEKQALWEEYGFNVISMKKRLCHNLRRGRRENIKIK